MHGGEQFFGGIAVCGHRELYDRATKLQQEAWTSVPLERPGLVAEDPTDLFAVLAGLTLASRVSTSADLSVDDVLHFRHATRTGDSLARLRALARDIPIAEPGADTARLASGIEHEWDLFEDWGQFGTIKTGVDRRDAFGPLVSMHPGLIGSRMVSLGMRGLADAAPSLVSAVQLLQGTHGQPGTVAAANVLLETP